MSDMLARVKSSIYYPIQSMQASMDAVADASGWEIEFVDPTNPTVALWEAAAVYSKATLDTVTEHLRGLYPSLAQTPDDLYKHMSYKDYINRFASPDTVPFIFNINIQQFLTYSIRVQDQDYSMIEIPRDTKVVVDNFLYFTLQYPIQIKLFDTGAFLVSYVTDIESPIESLQTNNILYGIYTETGSRAQWLRFEIPLIQTKVQSTYSNIQKGKYFVQPITFTDQFYLVRAFYQSSATGNQWNEMVTTYSPVVYDPTVPTMQLKVVDQVVTASIPIVYQTKDLISGSVRIDVYSTRGAEIINLGSYKKSDDFRITLEPIDKQRDSNIYTDAANKITVFAQSSATMAGGKDALTFEQLKARVMYNSIGVQDIPITNVQIGSKAQNNGFDLVANVDVTTNRIFLATRKLPAPSNPKLMTSANIGINTYVTDDPSAIDHPWVCVRPNRTTFYSKNLYQSVNGMIRLLSKNEVDSLAILPAPSKINIVNSNKYLYSPFYYTVDRTGLELNLRAYHLDDPKSKNLNFVKENSRAQLTVNVGTYNFSRTSTGYRLVVQTVSGSKYKDLSNDDVQCQLGIQLKNSTRQAYWLGQLIDVDDAGERYYAFDIESDCDIDSDDMISVTNAQIDSVITTRVYLDLAETANIYFTTSSLPVSYQPDSMQELIGKFMLPSPIGVITHNTITIEFGYALKNLWTRARSLPDETIYKRYTVDVAAVWPKDVYYENPADGSKITIVDGKIEYNILHKKGDPMLDVEGNVVYAHKKGDPYLVDGKPVVESVLVGKRELDILFVDGRNYFTTDSAYVDYRSEFPNLIATWILEDIYALQQKALEKTKIFFHPKNQLSIVTVELADNMTMKLESEQSFVVDLYVTNDIYRSSTMRASLKDQTIAYLDSWVADAKVSVSTAITGLRAIYGSNVESVMLSGLGGAQNLQFVRISEDQNRFCLRRVLDVQQDGTFIIREDVTVNFYLTDPTDNTK